MREKSMMLILLIAVFSAVTVSCGKSEKKNDNNRPPAVSIKSPQGGSSFKVGFPVLFEGEAIDTEDGKLTGNKLVWRSDINGEIGRGERVQTKTLKPGIHMITLTATDSAGGETKNYVAIIVSSENTGKRIP